MRKTLLDVAKSVCGELSFQIPVAVMSSTDLLFSQVRFLVSAAAEELLAEHDWQMLQRVAEIPLTGASEYIIPTDCDRIIPGTFTYSSAGVLASTHVQGSVSPTTFQNLVNPTSSTSTNYLTFQIFGDKLKVYPSTLSGGTLKFVYISNKYIQDSSGTEWKSDFTQDGDIPIFNSRLLIAATKLKLLQVKGLDTTAATVDFNTALELQKQRDVPAPILSFDTGSSPAARPLPYTVIS